MRHFLSLLFGLAAVVGFETTFGMKRRQSNPIDMGDFRKELANVTGIAQTQLGEWARPDGIVYVRRVSDVLPIGNGRFLVASNT